MAIASGSTGVSPQRILPTGIGASASVHIRIPNSTPPARTGTVTTDNHAVRIEISEAVYSEMLSFFRSYNDGCEHGGIIGCDTTGRICAFYPDRGGTDPSPRFYCPDTGVLEGVINREWAKSGIVFAGIVHSHPYDTDLSAEDIKYFRKLLELNNDIKGVVAGIVRVCEKIIVKWYWIDKEKETSYGVVMC